jgi:tetratricopeptide (TPR) repeat protein
VSLYISIFVIFAVNLLAQSQEGTTSVEELRHPLTGKSRQAILTAQKHLKSAQHEQGMEELRQLLDDPGAMRYAISMLAVEHLRAGQAEVALSELRQAVRLLPGRAENLANFAYALLLTGNIDEGLPQAHKALQLDPGCPKTRLILGMLLLRKGSHDAEAIAHIQAATQEIPFAHLALADHYEQAGYAPEAERERRAYSVAATSLLASRK